MALKLNSKQVQAAVNALRVMDFIFSHHGTVCLLTPVTHEAKEWCQTHLPDDAQRLGRAYAVEPRYLQPILDGIADEGLNVN